MMVSRRVASLCIPFLLALLCCPLALSGPAHAAEIDPAVQVAADQSQDGMVTVILHLTDQAPIARLDQDLKAVRATRADRHRQVIEALRATAERSQPVVLRFLEENKAEGLVKGYTPYWISNLVVARVHRDFLPALETRSDLAHVEMNFEAEPIRPVAEGVWMGEMGHLKGKALLQRGEIGVTPGLLAINADRCWYELGLTGAGRLICGQDTGVDGEHPALAQQWRGYGGAHPAEECWFDCLADSVGPPYDADSHGTHTMGTMCGIDPATQDTVGVAWAAQWIACNSIGQAGWNEEFDNDVIACFQWIADPDGNPGTIDDVPDVCQNSWGGKEFPPENTWYRRCADLWWAVIDNCEAAGVVVTFSAANEGPEAMSCGIPADRASTPWNTFAVGAVDATNYPFPYPIANFSSRGPSSCDEISIKPEVSAPGVDVVSSVPGGGYAPNSGTSMAGPHVAGVVALMREVNPDLEVDRIKQILMDTAVDHGDPGEDNTFGWGVIDAYAACLAAASGYGNLQGTVADLDTGEPLEGALVRVEEMSRSALSVADGSFDLRHLPAGSYIMVSELFGYDPDTSLVTVDPDGRSFVNVSLQSQPRGWLKGTVSGPGGAVEGVVVELLDAPVPATATNADGEFFFDLLPERNYSMSTGLFGYLPQTHNLEVLAADTTDLAVELFVGVYEDFEIDQGWTVGAPGDSAFEGIWERDDPNATYWGTLGQVQPGDDHTLYGVKCYVTHNQPENSERFFGDVDGGRTTLMSPVFDLTEASNPRLIYHRWFHDESGSPQDEPLYVDISNDGGNTWYNLETASYEDGGWVRKEFVLGFMGPPVSDQMRLRFVAEDDAHQAAIVEAAVDDIEITGFATGVPGSDRPLVLSLSRPQPNPFRETTLVQFAIPRTQEVDLAVFDAGGRLVRRLAHGPHASGVHRLSWDGRNEAGKPAQAGVYFVRLGTEGKELTDKLVLIR